MADAGKELKPVPVRRRSAARLVAVQLSYQGQMSGQSVAEFLPEFLTHYSEDIRKSFRVKDIDNAHLNALASAVEAQREELDAALEGCLADGWVMDRLTVLDRAVLRAGACELMTMSHLPARAVVSEYAAIADVCGCDVGFINAVLDRIAHKAREVEMAAQKDKQV
jgi:N utilization substance protein B